MLRVRILRLINPGRTPHVRFGSWLCENSRARHARRSASAKLRIAGVKSYCPRAARSRVGELYFLHFSDVSVFTQPGSLGDMAACFVDARSFPNNGHTVDGLDVRFVPTADIAVPGGGNRPQHQKRSRGALVSHSDGGGCHGVASGLPFSTTYMASTFVGRSPAFTSCTTPGRTCQDLPAWIGLPG